MTNGQKIRHEEPIYIRENNRGSNDDENFATMSMYNWERMKRRARWKYNNRNEKFVDRIHSFVFFFFFFFFVVFISTFIARYFNKDRITNGSTIYLPLGDEYYRCKKKWETH